MAGSTMKAFTIAAALKTGYSLKDSWDGNSPFDDLRRLRVRQLGSGRRRPGRYGLRPDISSLKAMEDSVNTAFVEMSESMGGPDGSKDVYDMAVAAGIPRRRRTRSSRGSRCTTTDFDHKPDDRLALGRANVSPINMANAYATIANGG